MLDGIVNIRSLFAAIYETYKIVPATNTIPCNLFTVEGIEMLVETNKLPREVATIMYKALMIAKEQE